MKKKDYRQKDEHWKERKKQSEEKWKNETNKNILKINT